jgi:hypothetical protein
LIDEGIRHPSALTDEVSALVLHHYRASLRPDSFPS